MGLGFLSDNFISQFFVTVIDFLFGFTGNYMLAVVLFALLVKVVLLPLDLRTKKAQEKTKLIQPRINAIKQRYKNDMEKQNVALRELYKKENVKMMAGCLPSLLQLPILFAMFGAINTLSNVQTVKLVVGLASDATLLPQSFIWVHNIWQPDSGLVPVMPTLNEFTSVVSLGKASPELLAQAQTLVTNEAIHSFARMTASVQDTSLLSGMFAQAYQSIPIETVQAAATTNYSIAVAPVLERFAGFNNGFFVFPVLAGGTQFLSSWLQKRKQEKAGTVDPATNNGTMLYFMPIMLAWFAMTSGTMLGLYWTLSNLFTLVQNIVLDRIYERKNHEVAEQ